MNNCDLLILGVGAASLIAFSEMLVQIQIKRLKRKGELL